MFSALLYLQYHSLVNRLVRRFKRLKQPKYLLGGIVGGLYFYFYFFRYLFGRSGGRHVFSLAASPGDLVLFELLGALLLLMVVLMAWLVPHQRAALAFTEAEVAFLFPAPISRRWLIHFKLVRSQVAILFTTFILMLVANRLGGSFWRHAAGWWLILSTLNLHLLGCSFARTLLLDRGISNRQRRLGILGLAALLAGLVAVWTWRSLPPLDLGQLGEAPRPEALLAATRQYLHQALVAGPLPYLLWPFRVVLRPYLAPNAAAFAWALVPALIMLALHYWWVVRADVAFEEASVEAARKTAETVAAVRAGRWRGAAAKAKAKRQPFALHPTGPPAVALLWKNLISAGQAFTLRLWIVLAAVGISVALVVGQIARHSPAGAVVGLIAGALLVWTLFLGPQLLRQDLRQDLLLADVLKAYPLRGWQVALGELLAPAVILTGLQWVLVLIATTLLSQSPVPGLSRAMALSIGVGVAMVAPMLNLITLQIPNAAVLLFPAWFQAGREGAQGIEATGQRIIFLVGQLLVLIVALLPAAVAFLLVFLLVKFLLGLTLAIPVAAAAAAVALAVEAVSGLALLGWLFERFDVAAEMAP